MKEKTKTIGFSYGVFSKTLKEQAIEQGYTLINRSYMKNLKKH